MANIKTKRARRRATARLEADPDLAKKCARNGDMLSIKDQVMRRDKRSCAYCGQAASTVDHVVPRCRGGKNTLENLVACCQQCNLDKGDKSVEAFRAALPLLFTDRAQGLLALAAGSCDHWLTQQRHDGLFCFRCGARVDDH